MWPAAQLRLRPASTGAVGCPHFWQNWCACVCVGGARKHTDAVRCAHLWQKRRACVWGMHGTRARIVLLAVRVHKGIHAAALRHWRQGTALHSTWALQSGRHCPSPGATGTAPPPALQPRRPHGAAWAGGSADLQAPHPARACSVGHGRAWGVCECHVCLQQWARGRAGLQASHPAHACSCSGM